MQKFEGKHAAMRKAPAKMLGAAHVEKAKGAGVRGAKKGVMKATLNHTAKMHKTSDYKG